MNAQSIEVELRGPLMPEEYEGLRTLLQTKGQFVKKQNRFLLDYSTFLEGIGERKLDVRVRVTNGKQEIIVKRGKFGGTAREEASVFPEGTLADTLKLMSLLGYTKAVACDRAMERYMIDGIEVVLQDVRDYSKPGTIHSRFFEAEIMSDAAGVDTAVEKIRSFLKTNNLREFSETEWNDYVAVMNKEANGVFDFATDPVSAVDGLGAKP